jgi:hypothetical protein
MVSNGGILEPAMIEAGYSEAYARSHKISKTKTWEELLEEYLPDELLTKVAVEGLFAKRIQTSPTEGDREVEDYAVRQRYLETTLKMKGKIIDKKDVTSGGKPFPLLGGLVNDISSDDSSKEAPETKEETQGDTGRDIGL